LGSDSMAAAKSALITGGAGFIGSHLAERLLADDWEVFALDDLSTGSERNVAHLRGRRDFHLIVDSVLKASVVNELVHRCDVVYHLAAAVGVRLIVEQPVHTLVTNIQGTENVLDHCNRFGKRVLVASTSEIYGDRREPEALDEESRRVYGPTTARRWAYAESKALDEFLALAYHQERGLDCGADPGPVRRGLRPGDRGHAPPPAVDREGHPRDRLGADPDTGGNPPGRRRAHPGSVSRGPRRDCLAAKYDF